MELLQNFFAEHKTVFAESFLNFVHLQGLSEIPEGYCLRPLMSVDYHRGYLDLLSQLTVVGDVTEEMFLRRLVINNVDFPCSLYKFFFEKLWLS